MSLGGLIAGLKKMEARHRLEKGSDKIARDRGVPKGL